MFAAEADSEFHPVEGRFQRFRGSFPRSRVMKIERDRDFGAANSDGGLHEKARKHCSLFTRSDIGRFDDSYDPGVGPGCAGASPGGNSEVLRSEELYAQPQERGARPAALTRSVPVTPRPCSKTEMCSSRQTKNDNEVSDEKH